MKSEKLKNKNFIKMMDITDKEKTLRSATASVKVLTSAGLIGKIKNNELAKGDVLSVAKVAGILAAKNTAAHIPLCHTLALTHVDIGFKFVSGAVVITSTVKAHYATGVEMEALVACAIAALTVYDMVKADEPGMVISDLKLIKKTGGRSDYLVGRNYKGVQGVRRP